MMKEQKKNWYDNARNRRPQGNSHPTFFTKPIPKYNASLREITNMFNKNLLSNNFGGLDFFDDIEKFGFQDKGNHYELTTNFGGHDVNEDEIKVELDGRVVTISFEHTSKDVAGFYSHNQKTALTLPEDADENTVGASINKNDILVITVQKRVKKDYPHKRTIVVNRETPEELF